MFSSIMVDESPGAFYSWTFLKLSEMNVSALGRTLIRTKAVNYGVITVTINCNYRKTVITVIITV